MKYPYIALLDYQGHRRVAMLGEFETEQAAIVSEEADAAIASAMGHWDPVAVKVTLLQSDPQSPAVQLWSAAARLWSNTTPGPGHVPPPHTNYQQIPEGDHAS